MTASAEARETALLAAQAAADKLATDVSIVDVSDRLAITDAFVLASAPNERQVQSIVDAVEEKLRERGIKPVRREGVAESRWVLLNAQHLYNPRTPRPPLPSSIVEVMRFRHPQQFLPYQYEGLRPTERQVLRGSDISMRLIDIGAPVDRLP